MKKVAFSCLLLFSTIFSACTSEEIKEDLYKTSNEVDKITVVLPQFDLDHSRTAITMGEYSDVSSKWADGDSIGIYPNEGDQLSFRIEVEGDGKTCTFDGGGWALRPESSYTAYSPFKRSYYNQDKNRLQVNMLNQCQTGNESTAHLGAYDIKVAVGEKPTNGSLTFIMERKVALVRMELTAPKAASWTSVSLESDALFTTEAMLNLSLATPTLTSSKTANSVTLSLKNVVTTSDNLNIIAYMMLLPVDLTGKTLVVKLTDSEGNIYTTNASVVNDKTDFAANGARWVTADNFLESNLEISVATAGTLSSLISDRQKYLIESLKVSGKLNGEDIALLRLMSGGQAIIDNNDETGILKNLDLSNATIVSGGCYLNYGGTMYQASANQIGESMFWLCSKLENIILPQNITTIGNSAFGLCSNLKEINIQNGATAIAEHAFDGCKSLLTANLPNSINSIGIYAFNGCTELINITLPNELETLGNRAFINCSSLQTISIPGGIKTVPISVFEGCTSLSDVKIGEGITKIDEKAFFNCDIKNLILSESIKNIGQYAFAGNKNLKEVNIYDAIYGIAAYAFYDCKKLETVKIGSGCSYINGGAFGGCVSLSSFYCKAVTAPTIQNTTFPQGMTATLYVPSQSISSYSVNSDNKKWGYYFSTIKSWSE